MLLRFVALLVIVSGCAREERVAGPEIPVVNPVIGDASFLARYGRAPTAADDATDRVRTHLAYAEALLRARAPSGMTAATRAARTRTLDHLRAYWERGEYPASDAATDLLPTFVDDAGVRCAVAYLAEQDLGARAIEGINARYRNAYIAQIEAPALAMWAATSGLSRDELAIIQPAYPPRPKRNVDYRLGFSYRYATDDDRPLAVPRGTSPDEDPLSHAGTFDGSVRWAANRVNPIIGMPIASLAGSLGAAQSDHVVYALHARVGTQMPFRWWGRSRHLAGATLGLGVDAIGEAVPRAWTVPLDAYYYMGGEAWRVGMIGGPRFAIGGDRGHGWRGAFAIVARDVWETGSSAFFSPRDLHLELGLERMGDVTFAGVSVSLASRAAFGWWARG